MSLNSFCYLLQFGYIENAENFELLSNLLRFFYKIWCIGFRNVSPVTKHHDMKAYRGSGDKGQSILNIDTIWKTVRFYALFAERPSPLCQSERKLAPWIRKSEQPKQDLKHGYQVCSQSLPQPNCCVEEQQNW